MDDKGRGKRKSVLPPKEPVDLVAELSGLRERLAVLDEASGRGGKLEGDDGMVRRLKALKVNVNGVNGDGEAGDAETDGMRGINREGVISGSGDGSSGIADLDRRLASLEEIVGTVGEGVDQVSTALPMIHHHPRNTEASTLSIA